MRGKRLSIGLRSLAIFAVILLATSTWAATNWNEKVLYSFSGGDGARPIGLIFDAAGNLYGATEYGGTYGYGTVFKLSPAAGGGWTEKVLHSFNRNGTDGAEPLAGLIRDDHGNLYGTTWGGGAGSNCGTGGCGTVFELSPTAGRGWTETVLHNFDNNGADGVDSSAGLIFDAGGNLYGTTQLGGTYNNGTVFKVSPGEGGWTETVLYSFGSVNDGGTPIAGLMLDAVGNLYGTTWGGGTYYYGTAFEVTPTTGGGWTEQVLHNFGNGTDGRYLSAGLIFDAAGNLYGTTAAGGTYSYGGTAFELTPNGSGNWTEQVLYNFCPDWPNCADGYYPYAGLIFDAAGNLYGTTSYGGTGGGTVFELTPAAGGGWTETVLLNFNGTDGAYPYAGLIFDAAGNLYGTT
ncbi:MAG: choice-of-anchor tandem repeat GloVer-containing protein, partial [Candidatus Korobacteraceae bacterium]